MKKNIFTLTIILVLFSGGKTFSQVIQNFESGLPAGTVAADAVNDHLYPGSYLIASNPGASTVNSSANCLEIIHKPGYSPWGSGNNFGISMPVSGFSINKTSANHLFHFKYYTATLGAKIVIQLFSSSGANKVFSAPDVTAASTWVDVSFDINTPDFTLTDLTGMYIVPDNAYQTNARTSDVIVYLDDIQITNDNNTIQLAEVNIDGMGTGRTFEGEGVLSGGGGNTKLLKDYPEPYRSQILDYLFKPNFGASYNELKVEIGGDINSTSGTEPSHARTLAENANPVMTRGYETWLIDQAKKRNPNLTLYGLEWGAPGWIGSMWSQNNANYLVSYIKGLKSVWGYDIDYIGSNQNESFNGTSTQARDYIVNILRPTLNNNGLSNVKIIAPDILSSDWSFADKLSTDAALKGAIYALGYHYVGTTTSTNAKN